MYVLIGCSLLLAICFLGAFIWSVKSGQMDDEYTPSVRILFDDIDVKADKSNEKKSIKNLRDKNQI
jgi:cbb3-type cytochrome oxidase maturation protein